MRPRIDIVPQVISPDDCDYIIEVGRQRLEKAAFGGMERRVFPSLTRKSKVSWFIPGHSPKVDGIIQNVINAIQEVCDREHNIFCNFFEHVQFTEYPILGHYASHKDLSIEGPHRLISATVELSPKGSYVGGGLFINSMDTNRHIKTERGTAVIFPSILDHRAKTVWWGVRNSLVFWGQYKDDRHPMLMDNA